jgi:hypothetical protein
MTRKAASGRSVVPRNKITFEHRLVLVNWMLNLFGAVTFEDLAKHIREPECEGFTEEGISKFHQFLRLVINSPELPHEILLTYDENIVRYWKKITEKRNAEGKKLYPKYFQYLCLLFTEIYLDRYFRAPDQLLVDLNAYAEQFNEAQTPQQKAQGQLLATGLPQDICIKPYTAEDLHKLAFWSATGSGKTLIMHINIFQYLHYLELHGRRKELNRTILLTPNDGLSHQHWDEFLLSNMDAELFDKDASGLFRGQSIQIIDVHKLRETMGEKTVAIDAFEGNNLVLVDEGHRGTSGAEVGHWLDMRNRLCEKGFSFEYSATFGQAMKTSGNRQLAHEYAKCILFDYSYKFFYRDGYGKDYRILNLEDDSNEDHRRRYLTACLLTFYQQQRVFHDKNADFRPFRIQNPLWIFVGGSVTKAPSKKDISDVVDILLFLARFVKNRAGSISYLDLLMSGESGLHAKGQELFAGAFKYLGQLGLSAEDIFKDILKTLFNAEVPAALHIRQIKAKGEAEGELSLHIGDDNEPFGLINVGDPAGLRQLCEKHAEDIAVSDSEFAESLFRSLHQADSRIHILIGAKKFSEGWSSWRVSTMGLMNVGKNEGSQIIQLFGRGVRLKGFNYCLKRSRRITGVTAPEELEHVETLNVFGIRADYMRQFREYLEDEGLPQNENRIEFVLPVIKNLEGKITLKTIQVEAGINFKKHGPKPLLGLPDRHFKTYKLIVDWYPKIQAMARLTREATSDRAVINEAKFTEEHLSFIDLDDIYFNLQQFKNDRAWYNLNLSKERLADLLTDSGWYVLRVPKEMMELRSFSQVRHWQEIAGVLLQRYCDWFYKTSKAEFESDHLEYVSLTEEDGNFIENYQFLIDQSRKDIVFKLEQIKKLIEEHKLDKVEFQGLTAIGFQGHLYQPLIYVNSELIDVKPVPLNEGERDFVLDLKDFCVNERGFFKDKELYLLRNMTRGHGIGFFEAGNFYPDFILWLLFKGRQYINFVDPKGLLNVRGSDDTKMAFYKTIKSIEDELRIQDPLVTLNSFIISNTPRSELSHWGLTDAQFEEHHVLFQKDDKATYVSKMLSMISSS